MDIQPLVSVYITNYNYGRFIRQSIHSVLEQSLQSFELLIIDDGSTDDSRSIIEDYRHHEKISIIYQQNKGLNVTNNIAMRAARGRYIMRLDADDYLSLNALEEMTRVLEKDSDLGLVFPDYFYVDAAGVITGEERRHNFQKEVSLYDQPAHGACTMIRLEFLKNLGGYNESFTCQDGYDLWIKFIMHHKVTNVNEPLFYYRRHGNNLTTNEERILSTRKKIKDVYVDTYQLKTPSTVAIIPVRNTIIGGVNWPLYKWGGKTILQHAIEKAAAATRVDYVVVTSAEKTILDHLRELEDISPKLRISERPAELARTSETLIKTFQFVLQELQGESINPEAILSIALEFPFLTSAIIDDAINTLTIFNADSLLSVRSDTRTYYQHIGHGMVPILDQDKFTKLEREALYKGAGGVSLVTVKAFRESGRMVTGKVGHIVVDEKAAHAVNSKFEFELFQMVVGVLKSTNEFSPK